MVDPLYCSVNAEPDHMDQFLHILLPDTFPAEFRDVISGLVLMEKIELVSDGIDHSERKIVALIDGDRIRNCFPDSRLGPLLPQKSIDECALAAAGSPQEHYIDPAVVHVNDLFIPRLFSVLPQTYLFLSSKRKHNSLLTPVPSAKYRRSSYCVRYSCRVSPPSGSSVSHSGSIPRSALSLTP